MKRRAISIVLALLMLSTTIAGILSHMNEEVKVVDAARATGGSTQGGYQPIVDYNWVWYRTRDLSEIVNNRSIPDHDKGRSFGSGGEQNASKMIERWMKDIGLENVTRDPITEEWGIDDIPGAGRLKLLKYELLAALGDLRRVRKIDEHWINITVYERNEQNGSGNNNETGNIVWSVNLSYSENGTSTCFPLLRCPVDADVVNINGTDYYIYEADDLVLTEKPIKSADFCWLKYAKWKKPYRSWGKGLIAVGRFCKRFKAFIVADEFNHTYFMSPSRYDRASQEFPLFFGMFEYSRPGYSVNGSIGEKLREYLHNESVVVKVNIRSKWHYDYVTGYNVIGELKGKDPSKVDIVCAHYDCWWNQGTIDEAAETALVLGIAKYMKELEKEKGIKPEHTVKFIAFGGEELGFRGSLDYIKKYGKNESIIYVVNPGNFGHIDSKDLCWINRNRNFMFCVNKLWIGCLATNISRGLHYHEKMEELVGKRNAWRTAISFSISGEDADALYHAGVAKYAIQFSRNPFRGYHRDGNNHTEGDVLKPNNQSCGWLTIPS